jgi:hypothetical protein
VRRAFEAAIKNGDLTYAAYCGDQLNTNLLAAGDPLAEVEREAEQGLAFARKMRFGLVIDAVTTQLGLIRTLRGLTPTFGCLDDDQFNEIRIERRFSNNPDLAFVEFWYWVRKLQARFFSGDYAAALDASSRARRLLWTSISQFETAEYYFYDALSRAASCDSAADGERQQLDVIAAHYRQLQVWAANCPDNFENRAALVGAEIARINGRDIDAMRLYEQAIRSARANGFVHNQHSPTSSPPASTPRVGSRRLPASICRMPATVINAGEPMARYGNSNGFIRIFAMLQPPRPPLPPRAQRSSNWTSAPCSRPRRRSPVRSS